ncbi:C40 family peptidase [Agromyces sp. MMS24-K17]|uniref:C40 family peptidase n=1 Tax=Agromyces sp. MMS24-K17 TaxID=3372850 RepID=UPI003754152D
MARSPKRRASGIGPRQSLRLSTRTRKSPKLQQAAPPAAPPTAEASAPAAPLPSVRLFRRGGVANVAVMTAALGIVGTLAIPAYAVAPGSIGPQFGQTDAAKLTKAQAQSVEVDGDVVAAGVSQDTFSVTTGEQIRAAAEAEAAAAAAAARAAAAAQMTSYAASYGGPSVSDLLANPPYPNFDLGSVYNVATQYIGTPYVYGGATPAGFDCSGFVMYVYAQFGIGMPHSSSGQGAMGTRISEADAVPGDLVIMSGHDGFYAGNGMILHAPYEGASVRVQPIWTSDYYIVRIGI